MLTSEELQEQNLLYITKFKVEKKNNKLDPDTYLANLNAKKLQQSNSFLDFEKNVAINQRELSPWTEKRKNSLAVDIMIKRHKDAA